MQQICHCDEGRLLSELETAEDVWHSSDESTELDVTQGLQPTTAEVVLHKRRVRSGDHADAGESDHAAEAVCVQSRDVPVASWSSAASRYCAGGNVSDAVVLSSDATANTRAMTGASYRRQTGDDDQTAACEADDDWNHQGPSQTIAVTDTTAAAAAAAVVGSSSSVPRSSTLTLCVSRPVPEFTQPASKKLRLPPPSPSLLSTSSGSPPTSPPLPPLWRPSFRPAAVAVAPAGTYTYRLPVPQQTTGMLSGHGVPLHATVTGPPDRRSTGLTVSSTGTALGPAWRATGDVAASQSSQASVTKCSQKARFSLRQLIEDDIIQPGHNVLSVKNPVTFYHQFSSP